MPKNNEHFIWLPRNHTEEYGWVYLEEYAGSTVNECKAKVLADAIREGYSGGIDDRLEQLGWEIVKAKLDVVHTIKY